MTVDWGTDPTEDYQHLMNRGFTGEHYYVALTARDALKCAELVRAATTGNILALDASRDVARLLAAVALGVDDEEESPTIEPLRSAIDHYPWPP